MIIFKASVRYARARSTDVITTGSVGIGVELMLAEEFNGLQKTVVFANGSAYADVVLVGDAEETFVPPNVLYTTGQLKMGIYAADGQGNIVIPTVWADVADVKPGVIPSGVDPAAPTPSWVAQVQEMATSANENAATALSKVEEVPFVPGDGLYSAVQDNQDGANTASGDYAVAIGRNSVASGRASFSGGNQSNQSQDKTTASGAASFAFGLSVEASAQTAVAFGQRTKATAATAFAAGNYSEATAQSAVAFGGNTKATSATAFAAGNYSEASGLASTALGQLAKAEGHMSTAIGDRVTATGRSSFVVGSYNEIDENPVDESHGVGARKYIFVIGNGTADDARSNAMTIDWDGNEVLAGKLTVGADPTNNMDVATKQYVDSSIPIIPGEGMYSAVLDNQEYPNAAIGKGSFATGEGAVASGNVSVAMGNRATAAGLSSIALGGAVKGYSGNTASGMAAIAIGQSNEASGPYAITIGAQSEATNNYAISIGVQNVSSGGVALATGAGTVASGNQSFTAGRYTEAKAGTSAAIGRFTVANGMSSFVCGQSNIEDTNEIDPSHGSGARKYLLIVGNGSSDGETRSNAMTVDWDGNQCLGGGLTLGKGTENEVTITPQQLTALLALLNNS